MPQIFRQSHRTGRVLSAIHLPLFKARPPHDYGILTVRGRKTGKWRSRCLRIVRDDDKAYLVAINGAANVRWAKNLLANPEVKVRLRSGRFRGRAREVRADERDRARAAYTAGVHWFERLEWTVWRKEPYTAEKSRALHGEWFDTGTPLVVDLEAAGVKRQ